MSEAMLDIVDENDKVVGQATREEITSKGLMCRIIQVFVVNDAGEILVQWRSHRKSSGPRLFDSSVGGHVDAGESYVVAAHREMQEELGITGSLEEVAKIFDSEVLKHGMFYITKHNGPFSNWQEEADKLEWFKVQELEDISTRLPFLFTGGIKESLREYKKYIAKQETK